MDLLEKIKLRAKKANRTIVLPESFDERTLRAADIVLENAYAKIILLGNPKTIFEDAKKFGLKNINKAKIVNPLDNPKIDEYANLMTKLRKRKGMTKKVARELLKNPLFLATIIVKAGDANGEVAGASNSTGDVLRPAFQYVKTAPGISVVSGAFFMFLKDKNFGENGLIIFADCAVSPNPTAKKLAEIAVSTGKTARTIAGFEPRIAMLSFSTMGSAKHNLVDKVKEELKTKRGLRSLSPKNTDYDGVAEGNEIERAEAYFQGSAWPWLLSFYAEAYLSLHERSGLKHIEKLYNGFEEEMSKHGIGSISELYDGNPPYKGRGEISKAWSVGALLQMNKLIEKYK